MSLGETIFRLRTEGNLSQGDLAEALNVSRQSISKWENNSAVPELDKLVKLSALFHITLDELVLDEKSAPPPEDPPAAAPTGRQNDFPPRKIVGTILLSLGGLLILVLALMGGLLEGLVVASPLLLCGMICFVFRRHAGLWCAWTMCFLVDIYLRYATGINWRLTAYTLGFTPEMNYIRLATAWGQLLCMTLLVVVTVFRFRKTEIELTGQRPTLLIGGWLLLVALKVGANAWISGRWFAFRIAITDWPELVLLTALLVVTLCAWRTKKRHKKPV